MTKKRIFFIFAALLLTAGLIFGTVSLYQQHQLKKHFELHEGAPAAQEYLNHDKIEDMDMARIARNTFNYARPVQAGPFEYDIKTPCDIRFYTDAALKNEAKIIREGSLIHVMMFDDSEDDLGRGFFSLPTFDKGVRYTRPFLNNTEETDENWYYVRLTDLMAVMKELLKTVDPGIFTFFKGLNKTQIVRNRCFMIDRLFYRKGIFLSPDIKYNDIKDIIPYIGLPEG